MSTALSVVPLASMCSHGSHVERPAAPSGLLGGEPRHWRALSGALTSVQENHSVVIRGGAAHNKWPYWLRRTSPSRNLSQVARVASAGTELSNDIDGAYLIFVAMVQVGVPVFDV